MSKIQEFTKIKNVEVLLQPGNMSVEPKLFFKENGKLVGMTLDSNEYENELGEFRLHTGLSGEQKVTAESIMNELAVNVEQVGHWTDFTLKPKYMKKLTVIIDNLVESKEYFNL